MARIIIVGAGVVGLSTARAARAKGHDVVLIERGPIPNPLASSWDSHRMIRHHYGDAAGYTVMVHDAFDAWDRLWADLGATHFVDTGAIAIAEKDGDYAHRTLATFRSTGLQHDVLDAAALSVLCPQYRLTDESFGVVGGRAGPLFADRIVAGLADLVARMGVELMPDTTVATVDPAAASVTLADGRTIAGDALVVAAGAWGGRLVPAFAGHPVMRQALCYVTPPPAYAKAWNEGPALVAYGDNGGYTLPGVCGTDLKFGYGAHRRPADPDGGVASPEGEAQAILAGFGRFVKDIGAYVPLRVQVGYYMMDTSRRFRIETEGRMIAVGNCDGQMFKFGPLMGERVIATIEGAVSRPDLKSWAAGE
ncbi:NAD(P)/FAD-dependent oxidoreductase [Sphingomonas solaris]|uniref:FAD-dependent oxidoreductase n=1 Tax=Alterirhizorhabdus solaris TaxID=2529389 RepID=A0A558QT91_9SPHN|nr:FAD-dependent oxidoreductase [Sphingomonas solaris]TVV70363.1 FAD-dependent oxidoreductase [Sphingomonas solaris]